MTGCNIADVNVEPEEYPVPVPQEEGERTLQMMIQDIDQMKQQSAQGFDDLAQIRRMINNTNENVNHHIQTVDYLKEDLTNMRNDHSDFQQHMKNGSTYTLKNRKALAPFDPTKRKKKGRRSQASLDPGRDSSPSITVPSYSNSHRRMESQRVDHQTYD